MNSATRSAMLARSIKLKMNYSKGLPDSFGSGTKVRAAIELNHETCRRRFLVAAMTHVPPLIRFGKAFVSLKSSLPKISIHSRKRFLGMPARLFIEGIIVWGQNNDNPILDSTTYKRLVGHLTLPICRKQTASVRSETPSILRRGTQKDEPPLACGQAWSERVGPRPRIGFAAPEAQ